MAEKKSPEVEVPEVLSEGVRAEAEQQGQAYDNHTNKVVTREQAAAYGDARRKAAGK